MRRLHVLKSILVRTHADKILLTYLVFVVIAALIIQIVEPGINRFVDALWYCYAVISTAGDTVTPPAANRTCRWTKR